MSILKNASGFSKVEIHTETTEVNKPQNTYPSPYNGDGYKTEKEAEKQLEKIVNDANNTQEFIDIAKQYSYRESVLRAYLFNIKDVKIYDDISVSDLKDDNLIIDNKKIFENSIKFIAKLAHDKKGFDSILDTFFKSFKIQLEQSEYKTELQKTIQKAIRNTNKLIFKTNSENNYGALCVAHMKHIFKDVIKVGGSLFCLKSRRYITDSKMFDTIYSRNGQEFILNVKLLHKKEKKEIIPYYQVNTTPSAYKAIIEAEHSDYAVKRCDMIINNPLKEYGFYTENDTKYFNLFIKPTIKKVDWTTDKKGVELFFKIHKEQYAHDDYEALLNWLAQIAQKPFQKLGYAPFLQGTQGTGKSLLCHNLLHYFLTGLRLDIDDTPILSNYCQLVDAETFRDKTNPYMRDCFSMVISEVKDFTIKDMNALKEKINGYRITINQHYKDPEFIKNQINFVFMSNYKNGLKIEANERRYLPIFSKFQSKQDLIDAGYYDTNFQSEYFKNCINWLNNQGGYAKIYDYLLNRDVSKISIRNAPITSSSQEAIESSYDQYTHLLSEYELQDVITACQARALIERKDKTCTSVNRVANALLNLGYEKHPIMKQFKKQVRYNKKLYVIYVKNDSGYKNESDKDILCSLVESFFKEF